MRGRHLWALVVCVGCSGESSAEEPPVEDVGIDASLDAAATDTDLAEGLADTGLADTGLADTGAETIVADTDDPDSTVVDSDASASDLGLDASVGDTGGDTLLVADARDTASNETEADAATDARADAADAAVSVRTTPTQAGTIVVSADQRLAVAVDRDGQSVSILDLAPATPSLTRRVTLSLPGEPWSVVLGNDDDTAFVILRRSQKVVRITTLRSSPTIDATMGTTGSEPTGLAISPNGTRLYVANFAEGTVSVLATSSLAVTRTIDLNAPLAGTGALGTSVSATTARPGLAHPRAVVVTNDGDADDDDETVLVTEFYGQGRLGGLPADLYEQQDVGKQGLVYVASEATGLVSVVSLAPVTDTGFADSAGASTGCFPNQLGPVALHGSRLYVSGVCTSPRGPIGSTGSASAETAKTHVHAVLFVVRDVSTSPAPAPGETLLLTKEWRALYESRAVADDATRRMPLLVSDLAFGPLGHVAYLSAYGSDAVFRVEWNDDGSRKAVGTSGNAYVSLSPSGSLPNGIAVAGSLAVVTNENQRNVALVSLSTESIVVTASLGESAFVATPVSRGKRAFTTGLSRWSHQGQAWSSCASCHPDGLSDGVTWMFARGPRQSTSLDGTYDPKDPSRRRILGWTAIADEVHDFETTARTVSGGVGALVHAASAAAPSVDDRIVFDCVPSQATDAGSPCAQATGGQIGTASHHDGLNHSSAAIVSPGVAKAGGGTVQSALTDWSEVDAFIAAIRAPRRPATLSESDVAAGRTVFRDGGKCHACHGGAQWTLSNVFYAPNAANGDRFTGKLVTTSYKASIYMPVSLNPPLQYASGPVRMASYRAPNPTAFNDQIQCILRAVGTFPPSTTSPFLGVRPPGWTGAEIVESRTSRLGTTAAQGGTGYNIPSLLGVGAGAPYFHAGNARTLEELLSDIFASHHSALNPNLTWDVVKRRQMIAFLLSIDEDTDVIPTPTAPPYDGLEFDPDLCRQFVP